MDNIISHSSTIDEQTNLTRMDGLTRHSIPDGTIETPFQTSTQAVSTEHLGRLPSPIDRMGVERSGVSAPVNAMRLSAFISRQQILIVPDRPLNRVNPQNYFQSVLASSSNRNLERTPIARSLNAVRLGSMGRLNTDERLLALIPQLVATPDERATRFAFNHEIPNLMSTGQYLLNLLNSSLFVPWHWVRARGGTWLRLHLLRSAHMNLCLGPIVLMSTFFYCYLQSHRAKTTLQANLPNELTKPTLYQTITNQQLYTFSLLSFLASYYAISLRQRTTYSLWHTQKILMQLFNSCLAIGLLHKFHLWQTQIIYHNILHQSSDFIKHQLFNPLMFAVFSCSIGALSIQQNPLVPYINTFHNIVLLSIICYSFCWYYMNHSRDEYTRLLIRQSTAQKLTSFTLASYIVTHHFIAPRPSSVE